jgi:hypothetical protein
MSFEALDNLVKTGLLKSEPGDQTEFDGLVGSGSKRLADAKTQGLSPESQFDLAYSAAHAFSLAAMRWHGYRPANKRYVVFQVLGQTLGMKPEVWRVLDKCHSIRNSFEYDGSFNVDKQLLKDLVAATDKAKNAVEKLGPVPRRKTKVK